MVSSPSHMCSPQAWIARARTATFALLVAGCPPKKSDPPPPATPPADAPGSQPGSSASAASLPANHSTSTKPVELERLFRMPESPSDVVLRVEHREVKRDALERQLRQIQVELGATGMPGQLSRYEVLNGAAERLIDREMRILLGKELKVNVDPARVTAWLDDLAERTKANPSFEAFLLRAGRDEEARKKDAHQAVLMDAIIEKLRSRAREQLTQDAKRYYAQHKKDYFDHAGREVWRMTIKAPRSMVQRDRDLAKEQAERLYAKVKKDPKNFVNFAKSWSQDGKASDGGYLGYVAKGTLVEDVEKQIWAAKEGAILPMRDAPVGFYIYRVGKKRKDRQRAFEEVKDKIIQTIYAASMRKMVDAELKRLRESKTVEVLVPELVALRTEEANRIKARQERVRKEAVSHTPHRP